MKSARIIADLELMSGGKYTSVLRIAPNDRKRETQA